MKMTAIAARLLSTATILSVICLSCLAVAQEPGPEERMIRITAKKFEYSPNEVRLKKGVPVIFELTSLDRLHGFNVFDFGIRADIKPGEVTRVRLIPNKSGTFVFRCDVYCGDGHEDMEGKLIIEE